MNLKLYGNKLEAFFMVHETMAKHVLYPDYLELVLAKNAKSFLFFKLDE
jgi:hypothetical protein